MINIIFVIDEKKCVHPCLDDDGIRELEEGQYRGEIEAPAYEEHAVPLWKYENDICIRRTQEEIAADIAELPKPEPTEFERLRADIDYIMMMEDL